MAARSAGSPVWQIHSAALLWTNALTGEFALRPEPGHARWVATADNNFFVAQDTLFAATVASDLNRGGAAIEVVTPTGEPLRSTVFGLVYWEAAGERRSAVIAQVVSNAAPAQPLGNGRLIFRDALQGPGVVGSVVLKLTRYSLRAGHPHSGRAIARSELLWITRVMMCA